MNRLCESNYGINVNIGIMLKSSPIYNCCIICHHRWNLLDQIKYRNQLVWVTNLAWSYMWRCEQPPCRYQLNYTLWRPSLLPARDKLILSSTMSTYSTCSATAARRIELWAIVVLMCSEHTDIVYMNQRICRIYPCMWVPCLDETMYMFLSALVPRKSIMSIWYIWAV